jgi:hypothetical protein
VTLKVKPHEVHTGQHTPVGVIQFFLEKWFNSFGQESYLPPFAGFFNVFFFYVLLFHVVQETLAPLTDFTRILIK